MHPNSRGRRRTGTARALRSVASKINVTPLVDVVLVLLVVFLVVTPMLQRGKAVALPRAKQIAELRSGRDPIIVAVTGDRRIWIDRAEVTQRELAQALTREMAKQPGAPVILKGDKDLDYRVIRAVVLEISKTRTAGVSLAAAELGEKGVQ